MDIITVTVVTQPRNTTGCVGGTAMFTCVMNITVNKSTDNIKWWRRRIDDDSPSIEIKTQGTNLFSITRTISGGTLTSILMITNLRLAFVGPYWLKMANSTQLTDKAFLSIVPSGTYVCMCAYVCGLIMYVHTYVLLCACIRMYVCV